ncbi:flagellar filament capping protein FliD [Peribacillus tepidiphilus]|uniref:flagellar filament capping protein FliD n=1 Tax=Peribacillus tepidiphilus TaxID=2652445 RepID=UPI0035B555C1
MRIGGLASGMDIDSIVNNLMKAERLPLDKLKQKKQILEWQRDDYRAMNTLLLNFRSELTQMKLSSKYRARTTTTTNDQRVTATASSGAALSSYTISEVKQLATAATKVNTGSISASSTDKIDATKGLYSSSSKFAAGQVSFNWKQGSVETGSINVSTAGKEFTLVGQSGASVLVNEPMNVKVNGAMYEVVRGVDPSTLTDKQVLVTQDGNNAKLTFKNDLVVNSTISVDYIADKKVETLKFSEDTTSFQVSKGSISELVITYGAETWTADVMDPSKLMNGAVQVGTIDTETGKITLLDPFKIDKDVEITVEYKQNYSTFNVGSHTSKGYVSQNFFIEGNQSLNQVINMVNSSNVGVSMIYDSFKDQVTLTRKETGNFNGKGASDAGYDKTSSSDQEITTSGGFIDTVLKFGGAEETGGDNAVFTVNGLETSRNSNTFEMNGVTITLKQTFASADGPVTLAVNNDSNQVFENIKSFVEKYNELISKIQSEVNETVYREYKPLTDEERESLSEKQQEQWEEKARSGMLRRDSILTGALSEMRSDFYTPVNNDMINPLYKQLASIGIKTTSNYLEGGKLEINEATLKKAIETDPESVEKLFNATGNDSSQKGIIQRLYDTVNETMDKLRERAGNSFSTNQQFTLGRQLDIVNSQIDRFEARLKQVEDRYWSQFTAMEKAIQKANEQSAYLMQQFSGGY